MKYCGLPGSISHGFLTSTTGVQVGDTARYECDPGFTLTSGTGQVECLSSGLWDDLPICQGMLPFNYLTTAAFDWDKLLVSISVLVAIIVPFSKLGSRLIIRTSFLYLSLQTLLPCQYVQVHITSEYYNFSTLQ